jgi:hypothetical protein
MEYQRIDLVSLFDLEFHNDRVSEAELRRLRDAHGNQTLENLYLESRNWISGREPIPTLRRFRFAPSAHLTQSKGNSILVGSEHGTGVFSVWQTITDGTDPLELKRRTWDSGDPFRELEGLDLGIGENDREYPFIAIRARTGELCGYARRNSAYKHEQFAIRTSNWTVRGLQ